MMMGAMWQFSYSYLLFFIDVVYSLISVEMAENHIKIDSHGNYPDLESSAESDLPHILTLTNHSLDQQFVMQTTNQDRENEVNYDSSPQLPHPDLGDYGMSDLVYSEPHRKVKTAKLSAYPKHRQASTDQAKENCNNIDSGEKSSCQGSADEFRTSSISPPHRTHPCKRRSSPRSRLKLKKSSPEANPKQMDRGTEYGSVLRALQTNSPEYMQGYSARLEISPKHTCMSDNKELDPCDSHEHNVMLSSESASSQVEVVTTNSCSDQGIMKNTAEVVPIHVLSSNDFSSLTQSKYSCPSSLTDEYTEYTHTATQKATNRKAAIRKAVDKFALDLKLQEHCILDRRKLIGNKTTDSESQPMTFHVSDDSVCPVT